MIPLCCDVELTNPSSKAALYLQPVNAVEQSVNCNRAESICSWFWVTFGRGTALRKLPALCPFAWLAAALVCRQAAHTLPARLGHGTRHPSLPVRPLIANIQVERLLGHRCLYARGCAHFGAQHYSPQYQQTASLALSAADRNSYPMHTAALTAVI